jgi:peptide/nickel transport system substrate-binding protein
MKKLTRFMVLGLVLMMVLGVSVAVTAQEENVIVFGWEQEPTQLNPVADMTFASLLDNFTHRCLWDWDINREIFPVMVEEIPSFENGMVVTLDSGNTQVTYKLREGMLWSDGEPITANDIKWFHDRVMMDTTSGSIQRGSYPEVVESLEVVDDLTFVMTYNKPWPDFLSEETAGKGFCFPQHVYEPALDEAGIFDNIPYISPDGVPDAVGYGPYVYDHWDIGNEIVFIPNEYWDGEEPYFDRVVVRFIPETAQMLNALEVGEIDIAYQWPDDMVDSYSALEGVEVFSTPGVYGDAIWMNYGNNEPGSPLEDVNVRKALIHAVDRKTLAEELVGPGTEVPKSWLSSQYWPEDLPLLEYDPDLAEQMLDEAGWVRPEDDPEGTRVNADGVPLVLRFFTTTRSLRMDYQIFVQEYLADVGVEVQLFPIQATYLFDTFLNRGILNTGEFDLAIFALSSGPLSPFYNAPDWYGCGGIPSPENPDGNNGWGSCDPEFDALDAQVGETVDPVERLELAHEAQRHFFDMQFWHGLYLRPVWYAVNASVVDVASMQDLGTLSSNYFNKIEYWQPGS